MEGSTEGEDELGIKEGKKQQRKKNRRGREGAVSVVLASSGHHQERPSNFPELITEFAASK